MATKKSCINFSLVIIKGDFNRQIHDDSSHGNNLSISIGVSFCEIVSSRKNVFLKNELRIVEVEVLHFKTSPGLQCCTIFFYEVRTV